MTEIYKKYPILVKAINFINLNNQPANQSPYHSIDHLFTVLRSCVQTASLKENETKLELELFIAALFHDYGHRGTMGNDHDNILKALEGLKLFHDANPNEFALGTTGYFIACTEYPYVVSDELVTKEAKILRDADMSYMFEDLSIVKLYNGLRTEFRQDLKTFVDSQEKFFNSMKFYVKSNQELWEICRPKRLYELKLISENI